MSSPRRLALTPLGKAPVAFAIGVGAVLPALAAAFAISQVQAGQMTPALLLLVQGVIAVTALALVLPLWRREAVLEGRRLRVKATFFTQEARLEDFDLGAAQVVDLRQHPELKPWLKTRGLAMPGLLAGHFRMRGWRKVFCLVSDPSRVLVLPHAGGGLWLLGLEHPQAVLEALRKAAA